MIEAKSNTVQRDLLRKSYRIAMIIYGAGIGAVGVYWFIVYTLIKSNTNAYIQDAGSLNSIRYILYFLTAVQIISVKFVKRICMNLGDKNVSAQATLSRLLIAAIISMSLCEAPAIYGIVVSVISRNISDMYIFMGSALVGLLLYVPRYQEWEQELTKKGTMII